MAAAGAAVAHVPLPLRIEIGCAGKLACDELTVTARELREDGPPALLASGIAHLKDGKGTIDLTVTLERAGARILEVSIQAPKGDAAPRDDLRFVTIDVSRDRVRLLHVAGAPTYDVRALRTWLKSDASIDVVAFFILRPPTDDVGASQDDLALIPFPVDELFSVHLPSFDAVVLQDFNAEVYGLTRHLACARALRRKRAAGSSWSAAPTRSARVATRRRRSPRCSRCSSMDRSARRRRTRRRSRPSGAIRGTRDLAGRGIDLVDARFGDLVEVLAVEGGARVGRAIERVREMAVRGIEGDEPGAGGGPDLAAVVRNAMDALGAGKGPVLTHDFGRPRRCWRLAVVCPASNAVHCWVLVACFGKAPEANLPRQRHAGE